MCVGVNGQPTPTFTYPDTLMPPTETSVQFILLLGTQEDDLCWVPICLSRVGLSILNGSGSP